MKKNSSKVIIINHILSLVRFFISHHTNEGELQGVSFCSSEYHHKNPHESSHGIVLCKILLLLLFLLDWFFRHEQSISLKIA